MKIKRQDPVVDEKQIHTQKHLPTPITIKWLLPKLFANIFQAFMGSKAKADGIKGYFLSGMYVIT